MTRTLSITEPVGYDERLRSWQEAIDAGRRHIELAKAYQGVGAALLKRLQAEKDVLPVEEFTRQYQMTLTNLEKGMKIERDAHRELMELQTIKPRDI